MKTNEKTAKVKMVETVNQPIVIRVKVEESKPEYFTVRVPVYKSNFPFTEQEDLKHE